jgi:hypothetical protein
MSKWHYVAMGFVGVVIAKILIGILKGWFNFSL